MKSFFQALLFLIAVAGCNDPISSDNSKGQIDSLSSVINSLRSEISNNQFVIDSLTLISFPNDIIDSLTSAIYKNEVKFSALTQSQVGEFQRLEKEDENGTWAFQYRIDVFGSGIYKSVYLNKIEYYGESVRRIGSTYEIDLEAELDLFGEQTNSLKFARWISATEFELATNDSSYTLEIVGSKSIKALR